MTIQHTGVVVSAAEADAWHEQIRAIMAEQHLNFGEAVNHYIERQKAKIAPHYLVQNG